MSDWKPKEPPEDVGATMVAVPRAAPAPAPEPAQAPLQAGATMVGMARVGGPAFGAMSMPRPASAAPAGVPEAGATMVGMARVGAPAAAASAPLEPGGTMVGMARVGAPSFGSFSAPPASGPLEAGGTMVGMARVGGPAFGGMSMPAPAPAGVEAGGTMVGMARVGGPAFGGMSMPAPAPAGGDAGGTMVGLARVGAPAAQGFGAFAAPPPPPRPSGPPPAYEILAHLGGGELGQVFHARHRHTGAEVALRIVRPDIALVPGAVEALHDVVALAQNAQHTHLGRQLELDETASATLVLEYVPGKQLAALMKERGPAPAPASIDLGVRLCSALAVAHAAGLAHGRLHAGNVVLEAKTGRWVLLDLGHGYAMQGLEPAHDLYALGALLYEMATGHSPFEVEGAVVDPRQYRPQLPAALSGLLLRTLSPDPAHWFASAPELAQALARAKSMA